MFIERSNTTASATQDSTIESSVGWVAELMTGSIAVTLCILAVAFVGFAMLRGTLPIKRGMFVALGAFVLLAAPVVATGFTSLWQSQSVVSYAPETFVSEDLGPREDLPPSDYDPYAGVSLRSD